MPSAHEDGFSTEDRKAIERDFHDAVNMTPASLDKWLESEDSKAVGWIHEGEIEAVGHQSGRHIVDILRKRKDALTDDDRAHMRKVTGYVRRHLAQRPGHDVEGSRWRYSLMNWGHDPLKD